MTNEAHLVPDLFKDAIAPMQMQTQIWQSFAPFQRIRFWREGFSETKYGIYI
jgi:hypothetical protein